MHSDEQPKQQALQGYLADRDEPCPLCSYNLRGLQGEHCPECGQELTLRVNLVDAVRGAYLAGLIGLACAFGFNALLLVAILVMTIYFGGGPPGGFFLYLVVAAILSGLFLLGWVRRSVQIRREPITQRTVLAIICWLAPLASVAILCAVILTYG